MHIFHFYVSSASCLYKLILWSHYHKTFCLALFLTCQHIKELPTSSWAHLCRVPSLWCAGGSLAWWAELYRIPWHFCPGVSQHLGSFSGIRCRYQVFSLHRVRDIGTYFKEMVHTPLRYPGEHPLSEIRRFERKKNSDSCRLKAKMQKESGGKELFCNVLYLCSPAPLIQDISRVVHLRALACDQQCLCSCPSVAHQLRLHTV